MTTEEFEDEMLEPDYLSGDDYDSGDYCWECGAEEPRLVPVPRKLAEARRRLGSPLNADEQLLCEKCWPKCHECPEPAIAKDLDLCPKHFTEQERNAKLRTSQHTKDWVLAIILLILVLGLLNLYGPGEIPISLGE